MFSGFNLSLLVVLLFFIQSNTSYSQVLLLGLKAGLSSSDLFVYRNGKIVTLHESHRLADINGGLILNLKIKERWYLHSEIIFEDKGYRTKGSYLDTISLGSEQNPKLVSKKFILHNYYIQFPQTIRFLIPIGGESKEKIYFEAGLYFAYYLLTEDIHINKYDGIDHKETGTFDLVSLSENSSTYHRFDWGATLGIGILFSVWKGQMDLNLRCDQMIQPFSKDNYTGSRDYYNVIDLTLGYSIFVKNKATH